MFEDASNYKKDRDLVLVLGDFNINGAELTKASVKKLQEAEADPLFTPVLPLLSNERKSLIRALRSTKNGPDYTLIDCLRES